jgi:hypothetical protein
MKVKKSSHHHHILKAAVQFIVVKNLHKSKQQVSEDEEATMVRMFYKTGSHRYPVQYWKLVRKKGTGDE